MPEFSNRLRLLEPCFRDSMCIMARRKRACGMVPRLGPAGFSFVMVCKGTGCTPGHKNRWSFSWFVYNRSRIVCNELTTYFSALT